MERWTILPRGWALVAAAAILLVAAAPVRAASSPDHWALIVGIDRYDNADVTPLQYASADARLMAKTLRQACGYPADHVVVMTSDSQGSTRPTAINILRTLEILKGRIRPGDDFLFYFDGHGVEQDGAGYLLTVESSTSSDPLLKKSSLSVQDLQEELRGIKAARVLQLVDASRNDPHGGRATGDNPLTHAMTRDLELVNQAPQTIAATSKLELETAATLFACRIGQRSYEGIDGHGYFTWFLVKGLEGGAADRSGAVTLSSLVDFLDRQVTQAVRVREEGKVQEPWADIQGSSGNDWVLARPNGQQVVDDSHTVAAQPAPSGPTGAPRITVSFPTPGFATASDRITLLGTVVSSQTPSRVTVRLNGRDLGTGGVSLTPHGAEVSVPLGLREGKNEIALHVEADGQAADQSLTVTRKRPPQAQAPPDDPNDNSVAAAANSFQAHADQFDVKPTDTPPSRPARPLPPSSPAPAPSHASAAPSEATLMVRGSRPGAVVYIDHTQRGYVPLTIGLPPGFHEVRVSYPGTVPVIQSVNLQAGQEAEVDADLQPSADALCDQAAAAIARGDSDGAARLLDQAVTAKGEHPARLAFYQGWLAEYQNRMEDAEKALVRYVNLHPSPTAFYLLGKAREGLGKGRLAVTSYKQALLFLVEGAKKLLDETGEASTQNQDRLQKEAAGGSYAAMLQLGWVYEQRGREDDARTAFRNLFELLAAGHGIKTWNPSPKAVTLTDQ